jgi:hypothetical protein
VPDGTGGLGNSRSTTGSNPTAGLDPGANVAPRSLGEAPLPTADAGGMGRRAVAIFAVVGLLVAGLLRRWWLLLARRRSDEQEPAPLP